MAPVIAATLEGIALGWALSFLSLFLILLILVQRGRGGGLTGALGGPGGQSAFGTKAGDMFTKITSITALIWIFLCAFTMWYYKAPTASADDAPQSEISTPADDNRTEEGRSSALDDLMTGGSDAEGDAAEGLSAPATPDAGEDAGEAEPSDDVPAEPEATDSATDIDEADEN